MSRLMASVTRHQDAVFHAMLLVFVAVLSADTFGRFWRGDDTPVLAHMLKHPLAAIFFVPSVWQELSTANLTPWISLSFELDYALGGMDPRVFYLHHLLSLWLVAVVAAHLFMRFASRWLAWCGVMLFLFGVPVLRVESQLFTRHYLEGLLFCLLALWCFLEHQRRGRRLHQVLALLCYACAMSAKEIYVPLGVLFIALGEGSGVQRLRHAMPYLLLLALYAIWRAYMLAGHVGGYATGATYLGLAFWQSVATSFAQIPALMFGGYAAFIAIPMLGVIAAGLVLRPRNLPWAVLLTGLVFAPLVPLVAYPGITSADRYLLLPWFLFCYAFVVQAQVLLQLVAQGEHARKLHAVAATACLALGIALLSQHALVRQGERPYYKASDTQMRHVWNHDASTAFMPDASVAPSFGMVRALGEIKRRLDPGASIPRAVLDPMLLDPALPLYTYAADCRCMRDVSATIPGQLAQLHHAQRIAPLSLHINNRDGWVAWQFGPYETGSYNVISSFLGNLPLPVSHAGLRTNIRRDIEFYLRYTAPDGWITYSPPLRLQPDGTALTWSRD